MIYNLVINQRAIIENKWDIEISHAVVFDVVHKIFTTFHDLQTLKDDGKEWYWVDYKLILGQIPILKYKTDWLRKIMNDLAKCDLLEINPKNQILGRTYFRFGKNAHLMFASSHLHLPNPLDIHQDPLLTGSQTPLDNHQDNNNNKNNLNINNKIFIDNDLSEKKEFPFFVDDFSIDSFTDLEIESLKSSAFIYVGKGGAGEKNKLSLAVPSSWSRERLGMFYEWLRYKKEIGKPCNTKATITLLIRNISRFEIEEVREGLDKCISSGYQGLFINKLNNGNSKTQSTYVQRSTGKRAGFITDAELDHLKQQLSQDSELNY